jgi:Virus neck protein
MPTSKYFNNYQAYNEQRLVEDVIVESIKIMGTDCYYLPNNNDAARDLIYGEDPVKYFSSAFPLEFYLSSALEYGGEKEFFSKFGLEIKNEVKVIVSKRSFTQRVPQNTFTRPREGDLIYVPFLNGTGELYEIKFTDQTKDFFMLGRKVPYFYELSLEKFKYSQEVISTGVPDIDQVVFDEAYSIDLTVNTGTGTYLAQEIVYQSVDGTFANSSTSGTVKSWTPSSNTLSITNIKGTFVDGNTIIGVTSNAQHSLISYDPLEVNIHNESYDNKILQTSANSIVDLSETNPFGSI